MAAGDLWGALDEDLLADIALEFERQRRALLLERLQVLQRRRVPLRVLRAAPVAGTVRLGFADGTALLVRAEGRGDALAAALLLRRQAVRVGRHWVDVQGPVARLCWVGQSLDVRVLGLDQPD